MDYAVDIHNRQAELIDLFEAAFSASEGEAEGRLISELVKDLLESTPDQDLLVVTGLEQDKLAAAILFSRLKFEGDARVVFLLSPVAVHPSFQRQGIGQAILNFGLERLRERHVYLVVTYGDPNYYGQVGFQLSTRRLCRRLLSLANP